MENKYFIVVDYQGDHISKHRSLKAAEAAIEQHEKWDKDFNEQECIDYQIINPD